MKALNVFGIIIAWILSIVLVIMLTVAPLTLSALSVLDPQNIVDVVAKGLTQSQESAAADLQKEYAFEKLSTATEEKSLAETVMEGLDLGEIEDIVGEKIDEEVIAGVLASDAMTDIFGAYATDVANALTGESKNKAFTAKKLQEIIHDNLDEIVAAVEDAGVSLTKSQKTEMKNKIDEVMRKEADKIVEMLPDPEEIAESVVEDSAVGEAVSTFLAQKKSLKMTIVGSIILLSVLIFFLRYPGFRGLRWLASDLFTAGGMNIFLCLSLGVGTAAIKEVAAEMNNAMLESVVDKFLAQFTTGVIVRTVIMLVAAVLLLVAYYLLKIFVRKKRGGKKAAPVTAPAAPAPVAPAVVPAPAPVVEPMVTYVAVEPEQISEPAVQEPEAPVTAENEN